MGWIGRTTEKFTFHLEHGTWSGHKAFNWFHESRLLSSSTVYTSICLMTNSWVVPNLIIIFLRNGVSCESLSIRTGSPNPLRQIALPNRTKLDFTAVLVQILCRDFKYQIIVKRSWIVRGFRKINIHILSVNKFLCIQTFELLIPSSLPNKVEKPKKMCIATSNIEQLLWTHTAGLKTKWWIFLLLTYIGFLGLKQLLDDDDDFYLWIDLIFFSLNSPSFVVVIQCIIYFPFCWNQMTFVFSWS